MVKAGIPDRRCVSGFGLSEKNNSWVYQYTFGDCNQATKNRLGGIRGDLWISCSVSRMRADGRHVVGRQGLQGNN